MPKVILYVASSLDGSIADRKGGVSWLDPFNDVDYGYETFERSIGAIIMGAKTYEQALAFGEWPYGKRAVFVLTKRTLPAPAGVNVEFAAGELPKLVARAKKAAGKRHVWLVGGGETVRGFLNEGLIDEIRLFLIPVILPGGIPLFPRLKRLRTMRLVSANRYPNGVMELRYVAGR